ncbi:MAG: (2Fe-2S)-binding protein [Planctomycetes bacterium]|nr:(2Fe-2S)-binding protein [Planctomycetota bacterium]
MPKVTIDGRPVEVPDKTTVFEAVRTAGRTLPHYCYHPGIGIEGSCRVCQVEVAGPGKMPRRLTISCRTNCDEGLEIFTSTPAADGARRMVLEFLLKNHPLDCPICDKAGECTLQNFAFDVGQARSRSHEERRSLRKRVDFGDVILFDEERCILCTRCVRFQSTVLNDPQLGVVNRGADNIVGTMPSLDGGATLEGGDTPLRGNYQGCLADICPVGALTLKKFRFQARAWQLKATSSACGFCSRGCNINVETFRGAVKRIRPRFHPKINQYWMCDTGRFAYDDCNDRNGRLSLPLFRKDGSLIEMGYAAAFAEAGKFLKSNAGDNLLMFASPFMTNEEGAAFLELSKTLGAKARFVAPPPGARDEMLYTGDPCPNRRGLADLGFAATTAAEANDAAKTAKAVVLAGEFAVDLLNLTNEGSAFLDRAAVPALVVERRAVDRASVAMSFPALNTFEKSGSFTNIDGIAQRVKASVAAPPGAVADRQLYEKLRESVLNAGHAAKPH